MLASELQLPILIGPSRKSFLGRSRGGRPEERTSGHRRGCCHCRPARAHIVRVHDVAEAARGGGGSDAVLAERLILMPSEWWMALSRVQVHDLIDILLML